jgi:hypothetical protein
MPAISVEKTYIVAAICPETPTGTKIAITRANEELGIEGLPCTR